jgi:hypothetical protein
MFRIYILFAVAAASFGLLLAGAAEPSLAAPSWQWYKADFHVHSVVSADAFPDLGVISSSAKVNGFNAVFLTDHNLGSNFPISGMTANHMFFQDSYRRWTTATTGSLAATTNELATSPVASGTSSLHLASTSSSAGETFVWTKRGPNFQTGTSDSILKFKVYPVQVDGGSGLYVSAAIGGDPTVKDPANNPVGYTTTGGVISPGKSTVFVFYFGTPPPAGFYGAAHVLAYNLNAGYCDKSLSLNTWISCTVDVRSKLPDLAEADQPLSYDALSDLKIASVAEAGKAEAYFDAYSIDAASSSADEFVQRNGIIGSHDSSSFRIFPSVEMGINQHANRFNFGITDSAQFTSYKNGIDGILPTQQSGYPAQLNHPGVNGGVSDQAAIDTDAEGADLLEVRQQNMIDDWDAILRKGVPVVGTWGGDNHIGRWSVGSQATFVAAPALTFDDLMQATFEGRAYMGQASFAGGLALNLDQGSQEPYPARYPIYVSPARVTVSAHVAIGGGLHTGDIVRWLTNNGSATATSVLASDTISAATYDATKAVPLGGGSAYVRAEVRTSKGSVRGLSEPILFADVSGLPADISYHVQQITTPSGHDYTRIQSKGVTSTTWDETAKELALELTDPPGSLLELRGTSTSSPTSVVVDGVTVSAASSPSAFASATGSTWYYDAAANGLYLKVLQATATAAVRVAFGGSRDTDAPSAPTGLAVKSAMTSSVVLEWNPSTDNVAVAGYTIYRDGSPIGTTSGTTFSDTSLSPATTHTYTVDAYDAAGNHSASSSPVSATTPGTITLNPAADSYVNSASATTNYGTSPAFYVDGNGVRKSYLRFDLTPLAGTVTKAALEIWGNSSQTTGYDVFGLDDTSWDETTINWDNQPTSWSMTPAGSSGPVTTGTWTSVDVTALVQAAAGKLLSLGLSTNSLTNLSLASRESTNKPRLVITIG